MLHNRFKKKLASCLCVLLAATCVLSSVPVGAIDAAAPLANDAKVNFALGCTYSGTNPYQENGKVFYPDTDHKELTDGVLGGPLQGDAEWVGYAGKPTTVEQVIDLGLEREFDTVEMVFNVTGKNAINMPTTAVVSYSGDGENWQEFSNEKVPKEEDGVRTYASTSTAVQGRYVKVQFTYALFTWVFLSEINVLGTQSADAPEIPIIEKNLPAQKAAYTDDMVSFQVTAAVTDGGTLSYQWYKDGQPIGENSDSYTISRATLADAGTYSVTVTNDNGSASSVAGSNNCVLSVVDSGTDPNPDPEPLPNPDPNNLAEGVTYTASQRANVGYPDNGKRLTDTITASEASYRDKAWVGFNKSEASNPAAPVTIIVDLKESKNFMEVRLNTLQNMGTGIGCPSSI
ncbi:MAG: discoidin domain-containing protein, partial [Oscillospiraceae bacterium]